MLIKTDDIHIGNFMARVHSIYAKYFNTKYKYIEHLYQDRYHTEIIENDAQLLTTIVIIFIVKQHNYIWDKLGRGEGEAIAVSKK